jgi:hypothetical protein
MITYPMYIIAFGMNNVGSACIRFSPEQEDEFHQLLDKCLADANPPVHITKLTGNDITKKYRDYLPFTFYHNPDDFYNMCVSDNAPGYTIDEYIRKLKTV